MALLDLHVYHALNVRLTCVLKNQRSPRVQKAKFYGRLRLICSVWDIQFTALKFTKIEIVWVYYTIPCHNDVVKPYI